MLNRIQIINMIFLGIWILFASHPTAKCSDNKLTDTPISYNNQLIRNCDSLENNAPENHSFSKNQFEILRQLKQNSDGQEESYFIPSETPRSPQKNDDISQQIPDSIKSWTNVHRYCLGPVKTPFNRITSAVLRKENFLQDSEFSLKSSSVLLQPNHPEQLSAAVKYGPIEIHWRTQCETEARIFTIERQLARQSWREIAQMGFTKLSAFPKQYFYEDISVFPNGTSVKYRIKRSNARNETTYSLPIEVDYLPNPPNSQFIEAEFDTSLQAIQLKFHASMSGCLRIELFSHQLKKPVCLIKKIITPGFYSYNIESFPVTNFSAEAFCRLEIISSNKKNSFIQIRQVKQGQIN